MRHSLPFSAAKLLLAVLTLYLSSVALTAITFAQATDEIALRRATEKFFDGYQKESADSIIGLWSDNAPEKERRKNQLQQVFAVYDQIKVERLSFDDVKVNADKATVRVTAQTKAVEAATNQAASAFGEIKLTFEFVKEKDNWKLWSYISKDEEIAAALSAAHTDDERRQILGSAKDKAGTAQKLLATGFAKAAQHLYAEAYADLQQSLLLANEANERTTIGYAQAFLGELEARRGKYKVALDCFYQSLKTGEEIGDKLLTFAVLSGIGDVSFVFGDSAAALDSYQRSLKLAGDTGNANGMVTNLAKIAYLHLSQGDYAQALNTLQECKKLIDTSNGKAEAAEYLSQMGNLYSLQGDYAQADDYLARSLELTAKSDNKDELAMLTNNIALNHFHQGKYEQAVEEFVRSISIAQTISNKLVITLALNNLGVTLHTLGKYEQALRFSQESLKLAEETGDQVRTSEALQNIARAQYSLGNYNEAEAAAARAVTIAKDSGIVENIWESLLVSGRTYHAMKQHERSLAAYTESISAIETMRNTLVGGYSQAQLYFDKRTAPYHAMVELLVEQGKTFDALAYAEKAKGRVLLDALQTGRVNITKKMTMRESEQEQQLDANIKSLNTSILRENLKRQPEEKRLNELTEQLSKARLEYEAFLVNLYAAHPELKTQRGQLASLTVEQAATIVGDNQSAALEYVVTKEKVYLFVLTKQDSLRTNSGLNLKVYPLPISAKDLARRVANFRMKISERRQGFSLEGQQLYDLLIKPAQEQLIGKKTWCIIPDDVLWHLPFQALQNNSQYVIEKSAVFYAPSLSVLSEMMRKQRSNSTKDTRALLAFANPSFSETDAAQRVTVSTLRGKKLTPLPEAETEGKLLVNLYGAKRSSLYIGRDAREEKVKTESSRYRVLHFATHGLLDDANPMYSHLVFAQTGNTEKEDGLLEAREILNLDLHSDLAVLSACDTALGRISSGEGVIGMAWSLFVAGVPATLASQWSVDSASTSQLMVEFHRNLVKSDASDGMAKAHALRAAELKLIASKTYNHPFYWAGFALIGDPR